LFSDEVFKIDLKIEEATGFTFRIGCWVGVTIEGLCSSSSSFISLIPFGIDKRLDFILTRMAQSAGVGARVNFDKFWGLLGQSLAVSSV